MMELTDKLGWLADKIPAFGDYGKDCASTMRRAADEITKLRAELESATKDAEHYRWMKSEGKCMRVDTFKDNYRIVDASVDLVVTDWFKSFDEAIDAAMKG